MKAEWMREQAAENKSGRAWKYYTSIDSFSEWLVCVRVCMSQCLNVFILLLLELAMVVVVVVVVVVVAIIAVRMCACVSIRVCSAHRHLPNFPHILLKYSKIAGCHFFSLSVFFICLRIVKTIKPNCIAYLRVCVKNTVSHAHTRTHTHISIRIRMCCINPSM